MDTHAGLLFVRLFTVSVLFGNTKFKFKYESKKRNQNYIVLPTKMLTELNQLLPDLLASQHFSTIMFKGKNYFVGLGPG